MFIFFVALQPQNSHQLAVNRLDKEREVISINKK